MNESYEAADAGRDFGFLSRTNQYKRSTVSNTE